MQADLHIHSSYSADAFSSVTEIIEKAKERKLQAIAIMDHNDFRGSEEALRLAPRDMFIIPGAEYSTDQGHFLVYFLRSGLEKENLSRDSLGRFHWKDIVQAAHAQDALVFLAHPYKRKNRFDPDLFQMLDGIEIYNSRAALSRNPMANAQALERALLEKKAFSAGSDAHWLGEIGHAFWEWEPEADEWNKDPEAAVKNAMRAGRGRFWGSPSSRLYEPASQIRKNLAAAAFGRVLKQLLKLGYCTVLEIGRFMGFNGKSPAGWLETRNEKG